MDMSTQLRLEYGAFTSINLPMKVKDLKYSTAMSDGRYGTRCEGLADSAALFRGADVK